MVIELGPPVSESSIRITKFKSPLFLDTNFVIRESKIGFSWASN